MMRLNSCHCFSSYDESNTVHIHDQDWRCSHKRYEVGLSNDEGRKITIGHNGDNGCENSWV